MQVYMPFAQNPGSGFSVIVRTAVDPASLAPSMESVVASVNKDIPISAVQTMEQLLGESIARQRMARLVLTVFAFVALALAAVGLYGLVAHSVTERTHEIGVRMALGAERSDVIRLVVSGAMAMTLTGVVLGIAGAATVTKFLEGLLFGVDPIDPLTLVAVATTLVAVAAVACCVPAWRATRIAPVTALRME
jgi:putative ABC transport system permease protein